MSWSGRPVFGVVRAAARLRAERRPGLCPGRGRQPRPRPAAPPRAQAAPAPLSRRPAFPQGAKIGLVNLQQIAALSVDGKASTAKVQALITKKQGEAAAKAKQLQDNQTKLQQSGALMNDAARAQLEKDIERQTGRPAAFRAGRAGRDHRAADPAAGRLSAEAVPDSQPDGRRRRGCTCCFSAADAGIICGGSGHRSDARSDQALRRARPAKPAAAAPAGAPRQAGRARPPTAAAGDTSPSRRRRDQHPHSPRPVVLPVSVDARRRDHRARAGPPSRGRQERHRQRRILPGPLPGRADAARRADARIAVAGGGDSAAAARRGAARRPRSTCAASTTRSSAARSCPATGCGSRSRSAAGARRSRARRRSRTSAIRSSPKPSSCSASCPTAPRSIRRPSCIPRRRSARGRRSGRSR